MDWEWFPKRSSESLIINTGINIPQLEGHSPIAKTALSRTPFSGYFVGYWKLKQRIKKFDKNEPSEGFILVC